MNSTAGSQFLNPQYTDSRHRMASCVDEIRSGLDVWSNTESKKWDTRMSTRLRFSVLWYTVEHPSILREFLDHLKQLSAIQQNLRSMT